MQPWRASLDKGQEKEQEPVGKKKKERNYSGRKTKRVALSEWWGSKNLRVNNLVIASGKARQHSHCCTGEKPIGFVLDRDTNDTNRNTFSEVADGRG